MALLIQRPQTYLPSSNPIVWTFEAENPAAIAILIKVNIETDSGSKQVGLNKMFLKPNSRQVEFDLAKILDTYTLTEVNNSDSLVENLDGVISYTLDVREVSATGIIAGSKFFQNSYSYNGRFNRVDSYKFDYLDYYVKNGSDKDADFLSDKPVVSNLNYLQKEHLYFIADSTSGVNRVRIQILSRNGVTHTENIPFNHNSKSIHRINVTPFNLESTLGLPLFEIKRITVGLYNTNTLISTVRTYNLVDNDCVQETTNLVWTNEKGGLSSYSFVNAVQIKKSVKSYINNNLNTSLTNNVYSSTENVYNLETKSVYTLTSNSLSDQEMDYLSNIIFSEKVFVELEDGSLYPVKMLTNDLQVLRKKYTRRHNRLELEFEADSHLKIRNTIRTVASHHQGFEYALNLTF